MQIEGAQSACPACGALGLEHVPLLHHLICAYVGPEYDFAPAAAGYICPKCRRDIVSGDCACEIVGTCACCRHCGEEMVVSPPSGAAGPAAAAILPRETAALVVALPAPRLEGTPRRRLRVAIDVVRESFGRQLSCITERIRRTQV
jgi:hypothetical protein